MALILNVETATTVCSVAVAKDGHLLAFKEQDGDYTHAENLTLFIQEVIQEALISYSNIDAVAVSKGPGSYTGLRIGTSTAKGLCYALNKPLIAIDTLQHIALSAAEKINKNAPTALPQNSYFCPMIDARRMEVYCALYDTTYKKVIETSAEIIDENFWSKIFAFPGNTNDSALVYFFGNGASKCREILAVNENAVFVDLVTPSAKNMVSFSEQAYNLQQFENVAYFEPFYLKDFVAGKKKG